MANVRSTHCDSVFAAAVTGVADGDAIATLSFVLRDERTATIGAFQPHDAADVQGLVASDDASRAGFYAQNAGAAADAATQAEALIARDAQSGELIGFVAYSASGELAGVVDPRYRGIGVGTLLVHRAAEQAGKVGLTSLHVELHPGSEETAEMLRDAGLASHWDIDYPMTRVTLRLGGERPGWSTPKPRAHEEA
jgi:GNAT superfamily N-acetyltransferase